MTTNQILINQIEVSDLEKLVYRTVARALADIAPRKETPTAEEFKDVDEAARILKVKKSTVYGLVNKNQLPYYKRRGRLYFKSDELTAWIDEGRKLTTAEFRAAAIESISR